MEEGKPGQESDAARDKVFSEFRRLKAGLGEEDSQLWSDATALFEEGGPHRPRTTRARRQRLTGAAVFTAAAAFEAVTNYLSAQIVQAGQVFGNPLSESEMDCLLEQRKVLENGKVTTRKQLYNSKGRFMLLFSLLSGGQHVEGTLRDWLNHSFGVRDALVHPKPGIAVDVLWVLGGRKALVGFLMADAVLASHWARARDYKAVPRVGAAGMPRPAAETYGGECET